MRIIDLMLKDLIQILRDWKAALFLIVMPIGFTLFFGFLFSGGGESDPRLAVAVVDRDETAVSARLIDFLAGSSVVRPVMTPGSSRDRLERQVAEDELAAVLLIPSGYQERLAAGEAPQLELILAPSEEVGGAAAQAIQTAVSRVTGAMKAARLTADTIETSDRSVETGALVTIFDRAIEAWEEPPVMLEVTQSDPASAVEEEIGASGMTFAHASPGMMVQFSIAGLMGAAEILVLERRSRSLQRLLTTAISRVEIILGHFSAMFIMIFLQLLLLIGFGQAVLGLNYLRAPLATGALVIAISLWTAALGLLIGVMAKTEEQAVIYSMIPMFVLSGLGGAWMPLEVTGETFQRIGYLLPTAWAMDGFRNILVRGLGLPSIVTGLGVMGAYAVTFFLLAVWRFRFES